MNSHEISLVAIQSRNSFGLENKSKFKINRKVLYKMAMAYLTVILKETYYGS